MKARISQFQSRHFKWRKGILRYQSAQICPENTHQALLFIDFWRIVWKKFIVMVTGKVPDAIQHSMAANGLDS